MTKKDRNAKANDLAKQILESYQPESVQDMQEALKDIFGPMFESMLKGELNHHLGYESNSKQKKDTPNRRNGYGKKTLQTSSGEVDIQVPRDRDGSFEPLLIPKRKKNISEMEDKVIAMYARGMSQRDISSPLRKFTVFLFRTRWSLTSRTVLFLNLKNGSFVRCTVVTLFYSLTVCIQQSEIIMKLGNMPSILSLVIRWKEKKTF